jgi:phosphatidylglycerophosphatase A
LRAEPLSGVARFLLAGLGAGRLRPGPGTWGSATVVLVAALAEHLAGGGRIAVLAFLVVGTVVTLAFAGRATDAAGRPDPGWVVTDEWAGQALALLPATPGLHPLAWLAAFATFRLLDVWKPGPIGRLGRLHGGPGVLLDDVAAGLVAGGLVLALELTLLA